MSSVSRSRRRRRGGGAAGIIVLVAAVVIIAAAGVVFGPRLIHRCDSCDKVFAGTGYYANVVSNTLSTLSGSENKILCRDCARREHTIAIAAGKRLDDYKRPLFEKKED